MAVPAFSCTFTSMYTFAKAKYLDFTEVKYLAACGGLKPTAYRSFTGRFWGWILTSTGALP